MWQLIQTIQLHMTFNISESATLKRSWLIWKVTNLLIKMFTLQSERKTKVKERLKVNCCLFCRCGKPSRALLDQQYSFYFTPDLLTILLSDCWKGLSVQISEDEFRLFIQHHYWQMVCAVEMVQRGDFSMRFTTTELNIKY